MERLVPPPPPLSICYIPACMVSLCKALISPFISISVSHVGKISVGVGLIYILDAIVRALKKFIFICKSL